MPSPFLGQAKLIHSILVNEHKWKFDQEQTTSKYDTARNNS